jgi:hypothetical protein
VLLEEHSPAATPVPVLNAPSVRIRVPVYWFDWFPNLNQTHLGYEGPEFVAALS